VDLMRVTDFTDPALISQIRAFTRNTSSRACRLALSRRRASPAFNRREEARLEIRGFYGKKRNAFRLSVDRLRICEMKIKKPIALSSAREVARALAITQDRFARAVRNGRVQADYIANAIDLFLPSSVKRLAARKTLLFP